ncbi:MAG: gamma-glutamylcyclotransferase [Planctomycetes bacterium]|nr:gamma-glutamylcyclotransferase [Planctomycetota bacterium]
MELYFAYGSNLWTGQMRRRCPSTKVESIATLKRHRLWFPLRSKRWGAGVASVQPDPMGLVEGALYSISWDDLLAMDGFEGVRVGMYRREEVEVVAGDETRRAWTYIGRVEQGAPFPTSLAYIATILKGAHEHRLSPDWIRFLQDFPVEHA